MTCLHDPLESPQSITTTNPAAVATENVLRQGAHQPILSPLSLALLLGAIAQLLALERVTLDDLRNDPKLTPQKFARYFSDFDYEYRDQIQPPDEFLAARKGDCDDYATLAFAVLAEKGFHPHLVIVRMPGMNHVVCYIDEIKGFLDYNLRTYSRRTSSCKPQLRAIAEEVADTFSANWTSASEFSYAEGVKYLISTTTKAHRGSSMKIESKSPPPGQTADFSPLLTD